MSGDNRRKWGIGPIGEFIARHGLDDRFRALGPDSVAPVVYQGQR